MNRFKFTEENISEAVKFLKGKQANAPAWAKRFKEDLTVKGNTVLYKGLPVVPKSKVDDYLREEMFKKNGTLPFGRDAAFHKLKSTVGAGITRRHLMRFIKAQPILESTKASVPQAKRKGGKRMKTYTVETDLIFIRKNDLVHSNPRFSKTQRKEETYIVSTVEKTTSLCRLDYVNVKEARLVTPIVKNHIRSIAKALKVHPRSMAFRSDAGTEFNIPEILRME